MPYFDIVPQELTLNRELKPGARLLWIVIRRRIQEGTKQDQATRSRRLRVWELAADLGVSHTTVESYLAALQKEGFIDVVRGSHNGSLIHLHREYVPKRSDRF